MAATGKYKVKQTADLLFTQVEDIDEEIANRELVFRVRSKRQVMDFSASSVEEKEKWVETLNAAIKKAMDKNSSFGRKEVESLADSELGKIAPVWVKDSAVTMCMECTMAFTRLKRRHHCRACGKIVCSSCSSYKASLEYDDYKTNRVCSNCYKIFTKGQDTEKTKNRKGSKTTVYADSVMNGYLNFKAENTRTWSKRWCSLGVDFTLHIFRAKKVSKYEVVIWVRVGIRGSEIEGDSWDARDH